MFWYFWIFELNWCHSLIFNERLQSITLNSKFTFPTKRCQIDRIIGKLPVYDNRLRVSVSDGNQSCPAPFFEGPHHISSTDGFPLLSVPGSLIPLLTFPLFMQIIALFFFVAATWCSINWCSTGKGEPNIAGCQNQIARIVDACQSALNMHFIALFGRVRRGCCRPTVAIIAASLSSLLDVGFFLFFWMFVCVCVQRPNHLSY